jgi:DNA-binding transcriptional MerR regulator
MDKLLSVEELAKAGNTTGRAVRLYIDKGLLKPMRIGRTFCFPSDATNNLDHILRAKRLGFSLEEIRTCLNEQNAISLTSAIKRIEQLIFDGEQEVRDLRHLLANPPEEEAIP